MKKKYDDEGFEFDEVGVKQITGAYIRSIGANGRIL